MLYVCIYGEMLPVVGFVWALETESLKPPRHAGILLPTEVLVPGAGAMQRLKHLAVPGTVADLLVEVARVVEVLDLLRWKHVADGDRVDGGISPAFVEEVSCAVEGLEVLLVNGVPEEVEIADLEVRPVVAVVEITTHEHVGVCVLLDEAQRGVVNVLVVAALRDCDVPGIKLLKVVPAGLPELADGPLVLCHGQNKAVDLVLGDHGAERVLQDLAAVLHVRLHPPVPVILCQRLQLVEEA